MSNEVQKVFTEFWQEIVILPNGEWDLEQVKKELYDFHRLMRNASEVYDHVTMGRISKENTRPGVVIGEYDGVLQDLIQEAIEEDRGAR